MKSSDIKIGEQYLAAGGRATALETRLELEVWNGIVRKEGVRVRYQSGERKGREDIISSRDIWEPWAEWQAREEDKKLKEKIAEQDLERTTGLVSQLKSSLERCGIQVRDAHTRYDRQKQDQIHYGSIGLDDQEMEQLMRILAIPEIEQLARQAERPDSNPLSDLLN